MGCLLRRLSLSSAASQHGTSTQLLAGAAAPVRPPPHVPHSGNRMNGGSACAETAAKLRSPQRVRTAAAWQSDGSFPAGSSRLGRFPQRARPAAAQRSSLLVICGDCAALHCEQSVFRRGSSDSGGARVAQRWRSSLTAICQCGSSDSGGARMATHIVQHQLRHLSPQACRGENNFETVSLIAVTAFERP